MRAIEIPCLMLGVEAGQMVLPDPYSSYFFSSEVQFTNEQAGTPSRPMYYLKYVESTPNGGAFGSAPYNFYMEPGTYSYPLSDAFYPNLNRFTLPGTIINNHPENGPVRIVNTQEK